MDSVPSSATLLCHTLVQDGAVPPGFQQAFEALALAIEGGTARAARKAASTTDQNASAQQTHVRGPGRKNTEHFS